MSTLVIGIGNRDRGDDAVGLVVAERLRTAGVSAEVLSWAGTDIDLIDLWSGHERVILVDALHSGGRAGTLRSFGPLVPLTMSGGVAAGSHAFGLPATIELARRLRRLPPALEIHAIEADATEHGAALSPGVARAAESLVRQLLIELGHSATPAAEGPAAC